LHKELCNKENIGKPELYAVEGQRKKFAEGKKQIREEVVEGIAFAR
jgi:hypothetical protein